MDILTSAKELGTHSTAKKQEGKPVLHKIASFICVSFKPLWTDILGETATLLSLCYFSETWYVSQPSGTIWAVSPHHLPHQALGQDPWLPGPTRDCVIRGAMNGKPRKWLEQNSPLAAKSADTSSSDARAISSRTWALSFRTPPPSATCFITSQLGGCLSAGNLTFSPASWGGKAGGRPRAPPHARPASAVEEIIPSHPAQARAFSFSLWDQNWVTGPPWLSEPQGKYDWDFLADWREALVTHLLGCSYCFPETPSLLIKEVEGHSREQGQL